MRWETSYLHSDICVVLVVLKCALSLALLPFVAAQDHSLDIKAIEAHFNQSHIVPDFLTSFTPSALLDLNYAGVGNVTPGQALTITQVSAAPTLTVTPANSSVSFSGTYTLAMLDAETVGSTLPDGVNRHWLVNGVEVTGSTVTIAGGNAITPYAGPGPAAGSGPHRYVVVLYVQPSTFTTPAAFSKPLGVSRMDFNAYVKDSGLGPLVAASYIDVEEGTATISIAPTSAVVTSTLLPASSSGTHAASTTSSSASATGTAKSGAPALSKFSPLAAALAGLFIFVVA
jgi:phosphatidylethanolamine-binding protein